MPHNLHNAVIPGHSSKDQTGETDGVGSGVRDGCNDTAHPYLMMVSVVCTLDSALLHTFFLVDVMWLHSNDCCFDPRLEWWTQVSFPITAFKQKPQLPVLLVKKRLVETSLLTVCMCACICQHPGHTKMTDLGIARFFKSFHYTIFVDGWGGV